MSFFVEITSRLIMFVFFLSQEYGMTCTEKLTIAQGICAPLLRKIRADLQRNIEAESDEDDGSVNRLNPRYSSGVSSPGRHVRTRLYFTSESHIHSLLTILSEGGLVDVISFVYLLLFLIVHFAILEPVNPWNKEFSAVRKCR